jgi:hypothetical protein
LFLKILVAFPKGVLDRSITGESAVDIPVRNLVDLL